jgi:hypothetical protein
MSKLSFPSGLGYSMGVASLAGVKYSWSGFLQSPSQCVHDDGDGKGHLNRMRQYSVCLRALETGLHASAASTPHPLTSLLDGHEYSPVMQCPPRLPSQKVLIHPRM